MNRSLFTAWVADNAFACAMAAVGGLAIWSSIGLPPPMLEPVGPAAFPLWAGLVLVVLSIAAAVQTARGRSGSANPESEGAPAPDAPAARPRRDLAAAAAGLTVLYVLAMEWQVLGFRWASVLFVFAFIMVLAGRRVRMLPVALGVALVLGVGLHWIFTGFFYIDLPG